MEHPSSAERARAVPDDDAEVVDSIVAMVAVLVSVERVGTLPDVVVVYPIWAMLAVLVSVERAVEVDEEKGGEADGGAPEIVLPEGGAPVTKWGDIRIKRTANEGHA